MRPQGREHRWVSPGLRSLFLTLALVLVLVVPSACIRLSTPTAVAPVPITLTASPVELGEEAYRYASQLVEAGSRYTGSPDEALSVAWLQEQYRQMGLGVELQDFPVTLFSREKPGVTVLAPAERVLEAFPLVLSASGEAAGEITEVGLGKKEDMPPDGLRGQIALVQRGEFIFSQKVANVAEAGASAAIIYNNAEGLLAGTLGTPSRIPAVGISRQDGLMLKRLLAQGKVKASVWVQWQEHTSRNLIAEIGQGNRVVVIGAHYDAVIGSPGATDNASGTAALLTVARHLAKQPLAGKVRLIAFGAEEEGLLGSNYYVRSLSEEERGRIVAMINLDVVGADVPLALAGETQLSDTVRSLAQRLDIELGGEIRNAPSDHLSFLRMKIPAVLLSTPDFSRIHSPQDDLSIINSRRLGEASFLVIELVKQLLPTGKDN